MTVSEFQKSNLQDKTIKHTFDLLLLQKLCLLLIFIIQKLQLQTPELINSFVSSMSVDWALCVLVIRANSVGIFVPFPKISNKNSLVAVYTYKISIQLAACAGKHAHTSILFLTEDLFSDYAKTTALGHDYVNYQPIPGKARSQSRPLCPFSPPFSFVVVARGGSSVISSGLLYSDYIVIFQEALYEQIYREQ